jgi:O-antigen ligase
MTRLFRSDDNYPKSILWLLIAFLGVLWLAGGSARFDVLGQVIVRAAAGTFLAAYCLLAPPGIEGRGKAVSLLLGITGLLVALQLVPLPPRIWAELPSRNFFVASAELVGMPQPWRPISISPGATVNALASLIVPATALFLAKDLQPAQHRLVARVLLAMVFAGCMVGLLQFSGGRLDNPLINEIPGFVAGNFANRNHLALFVAIGIVLISIGAPSAAAGKRWMPFAMLALLPFFVLVILATGSRSGLILGLVAIPFSLFIGRNGIFRAFRQFSRKAVAGVLAVILGTLALAVLLALRLGRAEGIERLVLTAEEDMRLQALPVVWEMVWQYFPVGTGFGTFDQAFRIAEPDALLRPQYFNHAHNDWLEVVLDGGLAGGMLLLAAVGWWLWASLRVWRAPLGENQDLAQAGSVICLLIMLASITDYPARTPMIMAVLIIAALWTSGVAIRTRALVRRSGPAHREERKSGLPALRGDL